MFQMSAEVGLGLRLLTPQWLSGKESTCPGRRHSVPSLGQDDPLEKEMVTHSSILAWRIPRAEEPGWLQSMGLQRVRHDSSTTEHNT